MKKKIIIIGAGAAGLAAGCYGQMNGYETYIFEANGGPGGLCTSWKRGEYLFESCIYWLFGTNPENSLNALWKELGVATGCKFIGHDEFIRLEWPDGRKFRVFADMDKLTEEMKKFAPEDRDVIDRMSREAKRISRFNVYINKPVELFNIIDSAKFLGQNLPFLDIILKYKNMPVEKFVTLFKSQFLREAIVGLMSFLPRYPALYVLMIFGHMHTGNANYPSGGSIGVAKAMEKRYLKLGGKINYNSKVESIVVKDNKAVGVKLADGKEHAADFVVSAADGYNTIFKMLEGKYISKKLERQYKTLPIFHSYMQVSFGVSCDLSQEPRFIVHKLGEPLVVGNQQIKDIRIRHYCFDASFAPLGKTSLVVTFACDYDYWNNIYSDYKYYVSEKERIKDRILSELCKRFPGISEKIEVYDIATPKTFERFSGNRKGAAEGWYVDSKTVDTSFERSLKGLLNFYMAGHWVEISGGIPFAVLSGRNAIQMICHKEKKKFRTCNS